VGDGACVVGVVGVGVARLLPIASSCLCDMRGLIQRRAEMQHASLRKTFFFALAPAMTKVTLGFPLRDCRSSMKRLISLQRYSRTVQCRFVVDGPYCNPQPVGDILLQDLSFEDLQRHFPLDMIHQKVDPNHGPVRFAISKSHRLLTLMRVSTMFHRNTETFWVPFLINTGSPSTFFTKRTIEALEIDVADHVAVEGQGILWHKAVGHFDDINLLGTDVLHHGVLTIHYPAGTADFSIVRDTLREVLATDGNVTFRVKPEQMKVMYLKKAIVDTMRFHLASPLLTIKNAEGEVLGDKDDLHPGMEYTYVLPHS
jgi:hypothetical protein